MQKSVCYNAIALLKTELCIYKHVICKLILRTVKKQLSVDLGQQNLECKTYFYGLSISCFGKVYLMSAFLRTYNSLKEKIEAPTSYSLSWYLSSI